MHTENDKHFDALKEIERLEAENARLRAALKLIDVAFSMGERSTPANLRRAIVDARRTLNGEESHAS